MPGELEPWMAVTLEAEIPFAQATLPIEAMVSDRIKKSLRRHGHKGKNRRALEKSDFVLRLCMAFSGSSRLSAQDFLSARFFRWSGCTSHAIAMLRIYKATIGAAKMHIFRISG